MPSLPHLVKFWSSRFEKVKAMNHQLCIRLGVNSVLLMEGKKSERKRATGNSKFWNREGCKADCLSKVCNQFVYGAHTYDCHLLIIGTIQRRNQT